MSDTTSLRDRTKAYASSIIKLYAHLQQKHRFDDAAMVLGKQLLRSGTSVAANHRETKHTRSTLIPSRSSTASCKNWRKAPCGLNC